MAGCRAATRVLETLSLALLLLARCGESVAVKRGALKLDNYTFDKMAMAPGLNLIVKVDKLYGYGSWEVFHNLCDMIHKVPNTLLADVPVTLAERDAEVPIHLPPENDEITTRYGITMQDFPAYLLFPANNKDLMKPIMFRDGFADPDAKKPKTWDDDEDGQWERPVIRLLNIENVATWLKTHGIVLPAIGTIDDLDDLVEKFMRTEKNDERKTIMAEATVLAEGKHVADPKAPIYLKIMKKVLDTDDEYVDKELARVERVLGASGEMKKEQKRVMLTKQKVLEVFVDHKRT
jgi:hypothetical protein